MFRSLTAQNNGQACLAPYLAEAVYCRVYARAHMRVFLVPAYRGLLFLGVGPVVHFTLVRKEARAERENNSVANVSKNFMSYCNSKLLNNMH